MKLTHMNSPWSNQLNTVLDRAQIVPIDPNKDYSAGVVVNGVTIYNWYDDITNVRVANAGATIPRASIQDPMIMTVSVIVILKMDHIFV